MINEILILLSIILFMGICVFLFLEFIDSRELMNIDCEKTLKELDDIIKFYCDNTEISVFLPLYTDYGYKKIKDGKNIGKIINDDVLNKAVINTTENILNALSKRFKYKLSFIISNEELEKFILSKVNTKLIESSLTFNKDTIRKMNS